MALNWWEYYEIQHNINNLRQEIRCLKAEIEKLKEKSEGSDKDR